MVVNSPKTLQKKSGIKNLIIDLAREGQIDAGDTISIEKGKTEK